MSKYRLEPTSEGVTIHVTDVAEHQDELLEAFTECHSGNCTCPTDEYRKLADMEIASSDKDVTLRLRAKAGTEFDVDEISACLDYTTSKVRQVKA